MEVGLIREELSREMTAGLNKLHTMPEDAKITTEQAIRDMRLYGDTRCLKHRMAPLRYRVIDGLLYYWNHDTSGWLASCHPVQWLETKYKDEIWVKA
jgi:hypothetical protein